MDNKASAHVDDIATLLQSLTIGENAQEDADGSVMVREASASVDVANDLTTMHQSLDVADDGTERSHVLEPKHKIFLSHSGAQKSFVADLCVILKRRDRHPFFDKLWE